MRSVIVVLAFALVVTWSSSGLAQPATDPPPAVGVPLRDVSPRFAEQRRVAEAQPRAAAPTQRGVIGTIWHALRHNPSWVPGLLMFLAAVLRGDRGAWWFLFLVGVATLVLFGSAALLAAYGAWLTSTVGTLLASVVLLLGTFGLFVLHQRRLDIFARTEITFGVVGVGYSVHLITDNAGAWAMLIVSIYGLVEGLTRLREADGADSFLAIFDGPRRGAA